MDITPTTTPATPPAPAPEGDKPKNKFFQQVAESNLITAAPNMIEEPLKLHEMIARAEANPPAADPEPEPAPVVEPPKPDPAPATTPEAVKKTRLIKLDDLTPEPPPAPVAASVIAPVAEAPKPADDLNAALTEEQRDRVQLLEWASKKDKKYEAEAAKLRDYFKRESEWADKNQDASDGEIREWQAAHLPKVSAYELRKLEREMIEERAEKRALDKAEVRIKAIEDRQAADERQRREAPRIAAEIEKFDRAMLDPDAEVPGGLPPVFAGIGKMKPEEAAELYPDEFPIYQSAKIAANDYLQVINGVQKFNPQNTTHRWLADFQFHQEQRIASDPNLSKRGSKSFLPQTQYYEAIQKDPSAAHRHWSLAPDDLLNAIMVNAHQLAHQEVEKRENARKKREALFKPQDQAPVPAPTSAPKPAPVVPPANAPKAAAGRVANTGGEASKGRGFFSLTPA